MNLLLERIEKNGLYIFGTLWEENKLICRTLENDNYEIPKGSYQCVRTYFNRGNYPTWRVNVENRTHILFHRGNFPEHSKGCILTGSRFGYLFCSFTGTNRMATLGSETAFNKFMKYTEGYLQLGLRIIEEY